ncbi:MAG: hypothetical protein EXR81_01250 [Gammaproteobacteria bacterium]|nr:hypothetical protein [Gammaproteobacteria bacterium]
MPFDFFESPASIVPEMDHACAGCSVPIDHKVVGAKCYHTLAPDLSIAFQSLAGFKRYFPITQFITDPLKHESIPGYTIKEIAKGAPLTPDIFQGSPHSFVYIYIGCPIGASLGAASAFWHPVCVIKKMTDELLRSPSVSASTLAPPERRPSIFPKFLRPRTATASLPPSQANIIAENNIFLFFFDATPVGHPTYDSIDGASFTFRRYPDFATSVGPLLFTPLFTNPHDLNLVSQVAANRQNFLSLAVQPEKLTQIRNPHFFTPGVTQRKSIEGPNTINFNLSYIPNPTAGDLGLQYKTVSTTLGYLGRVTSLAALNFRAPILPFHVDVNTTNNVLCYDRNVLTWIPNHPHLANLYCLDWDQTMTQAHVCDYLDKAYRSLVDNTGKLETVMPFTLENFIKTNLIKAIDGMLADKENSLIAIVTYHWDIELIQYVLNKVLQKLDRPELEQRILIRALPLKWLTKRDGNMAMNEPSKDPSRDTKGYHGKNLQICDVLQYVRRLGIQSIDQVILVDDSDHNLTQFGHIATRVAALGQAVPTVRTFSKIKAVPHESDFFAQMSIDTLALLGRSPKPPSPPPAAHRASPPPVYQNFPIAPRSPAVTVEYMNVTGVTNTDV